eukprot:Nk52_evm2s2604 gene=Nk52_evmTU2s2604
MKVSMINKNISRPSTTGVVEVSGMELADGVIEFAEVADEHGHEVTEEDALRKISQASAEEVDGTREKRGDIILEEHFDNDQVIDIQMEEVKDYSSKAPGEDSRPETREAERDDSQPDKSEEVSEQRRHSVAKARAEWKKVRNFMKVANTVAGMNEDIRTYGRQVDSTKGSIIGSKGLINKGGNEIQPEIPPALGQHYIGKVIISSDFAPWYPVFIPGCTFLKYWYMIFLVVLLYVALIVPYRVGFLIDQNTPWLVIDIITDLLFLCDIIVSFMTAYEIDAKRRKQYSPEGQVTMVIEQPKLVCCRKMIAIHYLTTWFALDVIATFPFYLVFPESTGTTAANKVSRLARLPRILRILRVLKLLSISRLEGYLSTFNLSTRFQRLVKLLAYFFLVWHILTCFWVFLALVDEDSQKHWIYRRGLTGSDNAEIYIAASYYVIGTITTVGFGDITAENTQERLLSIFIMFLGISFYSYTIASLSSMLVQGDTEQRKLQRKLVTVKEFMEESNLSNDLRSRIVNHYTDQYYSSNMLDDESRQVILEELSPTLRVETVLEINKEIVEQIPFFRLSKSSFVAAAILSLCRMSCRTGESVVQKGDSYTGDLYFITKGEILVSYSSGVKRIFHAGSYFGLVSLLNNVGIQYAKATQASEMYFLSKQKLLGLLEEYPDINIYLKKKALERRRLFNLYNDDDHEEQMILREKSREEQRTVSTAEENGVLVSSNTLTKMMNQITNKIEADLGMISKKVEALQTQILSDSSAIKHPNAV